MVLPISRRQSGSDPAPGCAAPASSSAASITVCAASRGMSSHNLKRHGPVCGVLVTQPGAGVPAAPAALLEQVRVCLCRLSSLFASAASSFLHSGSSRGQRPFSCRSVAGAAPATRIEHMGMRQDHATRPGEQREIQIGIEPAGGSIPFHLFKVITAVGIKFRADPDQQVEDGLPLLVECRFARDECAHARAAAY